jgi:hypothetical protein
MRAKLQEIQEELRRRAGRPEQTAEPPFADDGHADDGR